MNSIQPGQIFDRFIPMFVWGWAGEVFFWWWKRVGSFNYTLIMPRAVSRHNILFIVLPIKYSPSSFTTKKKNLLWKYKPPHKRWYESVENFVTLQTIDCKNSRLSVNYEIEHWCTREISLFLSYVALILPLQGGYVLEMFLEKKFAHDFFQSSDVLEMFLKKIIHGNFN